MQRNTVFLNSLNKQRQLDVYSPYYLIIYNSLTKYINNLSVYFTLALLKKNSIIAENTLLCTFNFENFIYDVIVLIKHTIHSLYSNYSPLALLQFTPN